MEMNIQLDGRTLLESKIEQLSDKNVTVNTYDDGTILEFIQTAEKIDVKCNKKLVLQPDGKTVKIV